MNLLEIEKLCNEASAGPWNRCYHLQSEDHDRLCGCNYRGSIWGGDKNHVVCEMGSTITKGEEGLEPARYNRRQELINAKFIEMSREHMPKLIELAKAASEYFSEDIEGYTPYSSYLKPEWFKKYLKCKEVLSLLSK